MGDPRPTPKWVADEIAARLKAKQQLPEWLKHELAARARRAQDHHRWT